MTLKVAIVSGPRSPFPMGLELAERRLLAALRSARSDVQVEVRVVGRRQARRHARTLGAHWVPVFTDKRLPRAAVRGADLVHLIGLDLPPPRDMPYVATVHDVSPLHFDDEGNFPPWFEEVLERAALIVTPSAFTRRELEVYFRVPTTRIRVIGGAPALDAREAVALSADELARLGVTPPLVLRYGGYTKRKNVPLLLEAWEGVGVGTLVLAGPPQPARDVILANASPLDRVVVLDYVPASLLARLLKTASVLVTTSSYEGYGLPAVEALSAGVPVVGVASPSLTETCGEAVRTVHGTAAALAGAIGAVLDDAARAQELREAGLRRSARANWSDCAARLLNAYVTTATATRS